MTPDNLSDLVKQYSRQPCIACLSENQVSLDQDEIKKLLPHREPFLLLDTITHVDFEAMTIAGTYHVDGRDPILKGHFPNNPVYPGVLEIEMINQLGLCLSTLDYQRINPEDLSPMSGFVTRILHSVFLQLVKPGCHLTVLVKLIESDTLSGVALGQVYHQDKLCSMSVNEVYFNE